MRTSASRSALMLAAAAFVGLLCGTAQAGADAALYTDLGERPHIVKIVDEATRLWLADPRVAPTFANTNMDRFRQRLTDQLCVLSGGPCHYGGKDMRKAHKGLHLDRAQFNALTEDLQVAMNHEDIPFGTQNRLIAILAPMQRDVVTR